MPSPQPYRSPRAAAQAALTLPGGQPSPLPAPPAGVAVTNGAAGNVDIGTHLYACTFTKAGQESELSPTTSLVVSASAKHGSVATIPLGPAGTTGRNIYRTVAANTTDFRLVGSVADNVTTTFDDNIADATLNAAVAVPVGGQPEADTYQEYGRRGNATFGSL